MRNQDMPPALAEDEDRVRVRRQAPPPQKPKTTEEELSDLENSLANRFDHWKTVNLDPHHVVVCVKFLKGTRKKFISPQLSTCTDLVKSISDAILDIQSDEYFDLPNENPYFSLKPDEVNPKRTEEYLHIGLPPGSRLALHKSIWQFLGAELGKEIVSNQALRFHEKTAEMWELTNSSPNTNHYFRTTKFVYPAQKILEENVTGQMKKLLVDYGLRMEKSLFYVNLRNWPLRTSTPQNYPISPELTTEF
jgi:hypothetical protein